MIETCYIPIKHESIYPIYPHVLAVKHHHHGFSENHIDIFPMLKTVAWKHG